MDFGHPSLKKKLISFSTTIYNCYIFYKVFGPVVLDSSLQYLPKNIYEAQQQLGSKLKIGIISEFRNRGKERGPFGLRVLLEIKTVKESPVSQIRRIRKNKGAPNYSRHTETETGDYSGSLFVDTLSCNEESRSKSGTSIYGVTSPHS